MSGSINCMKIYVNVASRETRNANAEKQNSCISYAGVDASTAKHKMVDVYWTRDIPIISLEYDGKNAKLEFETIQFNAHRASDYNK